MLSAIITAFGGSITIPANSGDVVTIGPLLETDLVEGVRIAVASADKVAIGVTQLSVSVYAHSQKPLNLTAAKNGRPILPAVTVPSVQYAVDSGTGNAFRHVREQLDVIWTPTNNEPFLSLVAEETANLIGFAGVIFAIVFRQKRE